MFGQTTRWVYTSVIHTVHLSRYRSAVKSRQFAILLLVPSWTHSNRQISIFNLIFLVAGKFVFILFFQEKCIQLLLPSKFPWHLFPLCQQTHHQNLHTLSTLERTVPLGSVCVCVCVCVCLCGGLGRGEGIHKNSPQEIPIYGLGLDWVLMSSQWGRSRLGNRYQEKGVKIRCRYSKKMLTFCRDFLSGANPVKIPMSIMDIPVFPFSLYLQCNKCINAIKTTPSGFKGKQTTYNNHNTRLALLHKFIT